MISSVPSSWKTCTVGEVAELLRGVSYKKPDATNTAAKGYSTLLRANNIDGKINFDDLIYVDDARVSDDQRLRTGDVVIAMSSGSKHLVGKAAQVVDPRGSTFGAFCGALRPSEEIDTKFFGYFFQTQAYRKGVSEASKGSNINNLKRDHITEVVLPLAPLNEQRRIVEKIDTLFARLDKGEEAVREVQKLLTRYRQSVLKSAVTGQLTADWRAQRDDQSNNGCDLLSRILETRRAEWSGRGKYKEPKAPNLTDLLDLPDSWTWTNMDALIVKGPQNGIYLPQSKYGEGTPIIRIDDFQTGWARPMDELRRVMAEPSEGELYALSENDFVVNRVNSVSHLGKTMLVGGEHAGALFESNMMRLSAAPQIDPAYLELYLSSAIGRKRLIANCKHAVNQASINQGDVRATPVPLPPADEQREIVALARDRLAKTEVLVDWCETELKRSASLRQSILKDAFAGRLVPQDPNDEPASTLLARIQAELPKKTPKTRKQKTKI